jgi:hypothetical protein
MRKSTLFVISILSGLIFLRCNDPGILGSDLLKDDEINLKFVDTFRLQAQTILDTGNITYDASIPIRFDQMPVGYFNDPVFGTTDARIYFQFLKSSFLSPPDFKDAVLDSIMLYIALDTLSTPYGKANELHDLEIFLMNEKIQSNIRYKTGSYNFTHQPMPIGGLYNYIPDPKKHVRVIEPPDTFDYEPNVAFKLSPSFGEYVMNLDTLWFNSDSIFLANVKGLLFKQSNLNSRMFNYRMNSSYSRLQIYYTQSGSKLIYLYPLAVGPRIPLWIHDHSPLIEESLNSVIKGNDLIFLQSLSGLKAKIEFPNLTLPAGAIINKAELEVTVINLPQDDPGIYTPSVQLGLLKLNPNGFEILTSDQGDLDDFTLLGGGLTQKEINGTTLNIYTLNISNHIQEIITGKEKPEVFLAVFPRSESLSRVVVGGPKHAQYPMKLRISYSTQ